MGNKERIRHARAALSEHLLSKSEPLDCYESAIIDLIADLLHLAREEKLATESLLRMAQHHFEYETIQEGV